MISSTMFYGRERIERALPYELGAPTAHARPATGLSCIIDMPVAHVDPGES